MFEVRRFLQARKWMKSNESFLKTWHAHVGYKLNLFRLFEAGERVHQIAERYNWDEELLHNWVEVGLQVRHLEKTLTGKIKSKKKLVRFATVDSEESAGILLREMMELHIPTLLEYPDLIQNRHKRVYRDEAFGQVVAETSTLLEKAALSPMMKLIAQEKPASVLDLGCGYGGYLKKVNESYKGTSLTGVEKNPDVYGHARCSLPEHVLLYNEDLETFLQGGHNPVDLVMVHNLLYYFPVSSRRRLMQQIAGITNAGGKITIITPVKGESTGGMFTSAFNAFMTAHDNLYPLPDMAELRGLAKDAGLDFTSVKPIIREGGWFLVILTKK